MNKIGILLLVLKSIQVFGKSDSVDYPLWETLEDDDNEVDVKISSRAGSTFSYEEGDPYGPSNWAKLNAACNGTRQSPIDIKLLSVTKSELPFSLGPVVLSRASDKPSSIAVLNNGHSFVVKWNYADGKPATFIGGPLKETYNVDSIHWHWGSDDKMGSEHTILGYSFAAEGHIVSYNAKYGTLANAVAQPDGLAVLGVFYRISLDATSNPWVSLVKNVIQPKVVYTETTNLFSIKDVVKDEKFYVLSYLGSLTTPNCNEVVTWMVTTLQLPINSSELAELRKILNEEGKPITKNFRPVQPLNNRGVKLFL